MTEKTFSASCTVNTGFNSGGSPTLFQQAEQQATDEWNKYNEEIRERFIRTRAETLVLEWNKS